VKRLRGGLVFKAHRLVYHSTLGLRVIKKKKKFRRRGSVAASHQPAEVGQIVFVNCRDLYHTSPDSGERQYELRIWKRRYDRGWVSGFVVWCVGFQGLWFGVWGFGVQWVRCIEIRTSGHVSELGDYGLGMTAQGSGLHVQCVGFEV